MTRNIITKVNNIFDYYIKYGANKYNNNLSILEYSFQTSIIAEKYNLGNSLIISAFLHDIGKLIGIEQYYTDIKNYKKDYELQNYLIRNYDKIGEKYLEELGFTKCITEPIGLQVVAKRYLITINKNYYNVLSNNSKISLKYQGVIMTNDEITHFLNNKYYKESILLRLCNDNAKFISVNNLNYDNYYDKYYDMIYNYLFKINEKNKK